MKLYRYLLVGILAVAVLAMVPVQALAVPVDLELQLLVDVSGSVDSTEFALQRTGYQNAFLNAGIQAAILDTNGGDIGSIAAQLIYWSRSNSQQVAVGWTLLNTNASINAFAASIGAAGRPFGGATAPGSAINFGTPLFTGNGFEGTRLVMDVSGDGRKNSGANTSAARDAALAAGIDTINGLVIGGSASVANFYTNNVIGGGGFLVEAADFNAFEAAVITKIGREVVGDPIPEPSTMLLFGTGMLGLAAWRRFKKNV